MYKKLQPVLDKELSSIKDAGLLKRERIITTPQGADIKTLDGREVINFCANNYLGLSSHPRVIDAAKRTIDTHGFGLSSVRFICGTQDIHKELERKISTFLGTEDTILYAAAFDANGGVFEPLLGEKDAIISDELNHASIIDGVRLCKAMRYRYKHNQMEDLEKQLQDARHAGANQIMVVTDGAFSMDGTIAQLDKICDLADRYDALVMTDECHSMGFIGKTGRGVPEYWGVGDRVDIITGTLGKAMGGAVGGFISGKRDVISYLRQTSRPYIFSNSLPPCLAYSAMKAFELLQNDKSLVKKLRDNTNYFRKEIKNLGYKIIDGIHPIVPIMLGEAALAQNASFELLKEGVYIKGLWFPVVPRGEARLRGQISAAHTKKDLDRALNAFQKVGKRLKII